MNLCLYHTHTVSVCALTTLFKREFFNPNLCAQEVFYFVWCFGKLVHFTSKNARFKSLSAADADASTAAAAVAATTTCYKTACLNLIVLLCSAFFLIVFICLRSVIRLFALSFTHFNLLAFARFTRVLLYALNVFLFFLFSNSILFQWKQNGKN